MPINTNQCEALPMSPNTSHTKKTWLAAVGRFDAVALATYLWTQLIYATGVEMLLSGTTSSYSNDCDATQMTKTGALYVLLMFSGMTLLWILGALARLYYWTDRHIRPGFAMIHNVDMGAISMLLLVQRHWAAARVPIAFESVGMVDAVVPVTVLLTLPIAVYHARTLEPPQKTIKMKHD